MDKRNNDSDGALRTFEFPRADDIEAVVEFYERTGAMPVNSIGPPIDRPIVPPRRPDHVGDFQFTTVGGTPTPPETAEGNEGEQIRKEFLDKVRKKLKDL